MEGGVRRVWWWGIDFVVVWGEWVEGWVCGGGGGVDGGRFIFREREGGGGGQNHTTPLKKFKKTSIVWMLKARENPGTNLGEQLLGLGPNKYIIVPSLKHT